VARCWLEIDPNALVANARLLRRAVPVGAALMAVVKAEAYGHRAVEVVQLLKDEIEFFAVANVEEAMALRTLIDPERIFVMSALLTDELALLVEQGFITWISSLREAQLINDLAATHGRRAAVHFKIDTGMGRLGVLPDQAEDLFRRSLELENLELTGIATHLPVADEDEAATDRQLDQFERLVDSLRAAGFDGHWVQACNSAGSLRHPVGNLFRFGLSLYGESPVDEPVGLQFPLTWKAAVVAVRDIPKGHPVSYGSTWRAPRPTRMAVLGVGYADGYPRALSNTDARVLIHGVSCPLLGRVTMDQIMVDITDHPRVAVGEEAVLLGPGGDDRIRARELAERSNTIAWEIFTNVSRPRVDWFFLSLTSEPAAPTPLVAKSLR